MSGPEFFQTPMGHRFFEGTMPDIAKQLRRLNEHLERIKPLKAEVDIATLVIQKCAAEAKRIGSADPPTKTGLKSYGEGWYDAAQYITTAILNLQGDVDRAAKEISNDS